MFRNKYPDFNRDINSLQDNLIEITPQLLNILQSSIKDLIEIADNAYIHNQKIIMKT